MKRHLHAGGIGVGLSISLQVHITSASKAITYSLNTNCDQQATITAIHVLL